MRQKHNMRRMKTSGREFITLFVLILSAYDSELRTEEKKKKKKKKKKTQMYVIENLHGDLW